MTDPLNEAIALFARFEETGDRAPLDRGLELLDRTAARMPPQSPDLPPVLLAMGSAHRMRYPVTRNLADLVRSLEALGAAYREQSRLGGDTFDYLDELCTTRGAYYVETGNRDLIDEAIAGRESMRPQYANAPERLVRVLHNLGMDYRHRFDGEGDPEDLEHAGRAFGDALELLAEDDPNRGRLLLGLADVLQRRYAVADDPSDLRAAVHYRADALRRLPDTTAAYFDQALTLADELSALYAATNDQALLEQAIAIMDQAATSGVVSPTMVPRIHNNMAALILTRYAATSDVADLDDAEAELSLAIDAVDAAARAAPEAAADRPRFELGLAGVLRERYARTHNQADLDRATELERRAGR
jgi:hypothetical protein